MPTKWTDTNYIQFTEEQLFILNQITSIEIENNNVQTNDQAERKPRNIDSIIRNQTFVRQVKRLRNNTCQIYSIKLQIGPNSYYSEIHQIRPLGKPHNGPDILSNMICVCPNCHVNLDYGFSKIDKTTIIDIANHSIASQHIDYHNSRVETVLRTILLRSRLS